MTIVQSFGALLVAVNIGIAFVDWLVNVVKGAMDAA